MAIYSRPFTFDRVVRITFAVAAAVAAIWLINYLKYVLLPFCVAVLLAYMLEPFVQYNRRLLHLNGRIIAVFVTLFETIFFAGIAAYLIIPYMFDEFHQMGELLRRYATTELKIPYLPEQIHQFIKRNIDLDALSEILKKQEWVSIIEQVFSTSWDIITGSIEMLIGLFNWLLVIIYLLFVMLDYDRIARGLRWIIPPKYRTVAYRLGDDIKNSMNHYFRGQATVAFIVGVLFCIGFLIIGLPLAIPLGLMIGLMNMVPYLQLASIPVTALLCLIYAVGGYEGGFWSIFGQAILVYCIVQAIQDLFLTPKIMGKAMGLNPALILLSLSIWGALLGIIGMIIALPMTTLLISYYDRYIIHHNNTPEEYDDTEAEDY